MLSLWGNQLTGRIPTELENLSNLRTLWLDGNPLTGCIPQRLQDVPENDLNRLGLPLCSVSLPGAPTIATVMPGMGTLVISWRPPSNRGGTAITAYDLRYVETSADETMDSNWTVNEEVWTPEAVPYSTSLPDSLPIRSTTSKYGRKTLWETAHGRKP